MRIFWDFLRLVNQFLKGSLQISTFDRSKNKRELISRRYFFFWERKNFSRRFFSEESFQTKLPTETKVSRFWGIEVLSWPKHRSQVGELREMVKRDTVHNFQHLLCLCGILSHQKSCDVNGHVLKVRGWDLKTKMLMERQNVKT